MSMSRNDFVAIAAQVRRSVDHADETIAKAKFRIEHETALVAVNGVADLANRLADEFKRANSAFRYDTFFAACGLDEYGTYVDKKNGYDSYN